MARHNTRRGLLFPVAVGILAAALLHSFPAKTAEEPSAGRIAGRVGDFHRQEGLAPIRVKEIELFTHGSPRPAAVATPNDTGEFTFDAVPAGHVVLHPVLVDSEGRDASNPSALRSPGIVRAGETLRVVLFGKGRPVCGRLKLPAHLAPENCRVELTYVAPPFRTRKDRTRQTTPSWHAYALLTQKKREAPVAPDGRFWITGVREGNYRLTVMRTVDGKPVTLTWDRSTEKDRLPDRVSVPLMSEVETDKPLNLGASVWHER